MRLRPGPSCFVSSILAVALAVAPLAAQQPQTPPAKTQGDEIPAQQEQTSEEPSAPVVDDTTQQSVGTTVPVESASTAAESTLPNVTKNSIPLANPTSSPQPAASSDSPGESKWIILAAIITTAAVVGAILLFRAFGGGGKSSSKSGPVGTIITAGTPTVNAPGK